MSPATERLGVIALAGMTFLSGCRETLEPHPAPATAAEPEKAQISRPYVKIDEDTYLLQPPGREENSLAGSFSKNLAQFRRDVPGEFTLIPADTEFPLYHEAMLIRTNAASKSGRNEVHIGSNDTLVKQDNTDKPGKEAPEHTATPIRHRRTCEELSR